MKITRSGEKVLSQGHSDAIRRVEGVKGGVQYTVPIDEAIEKVRSGVNPELSTAEKHRRVCYVVAEEGYDQAKIEQDIETMPNYFADYETEVNFITEEELKENHSKLPHGGFVIRGGKTGQDNKQIIEFSLNLESNPEFTASVLVAYARAAYRLNKEGQAGAKTVFDVAPGIFVSKICRRIEKRSIVIVTEVPAPRCIHDLMHWGLGTFILVKRDRSAEPDYQVRSGSKCNYQMQQKNILQLVGQGAYPCVHLLF